ncbi:uncharacterized protein LOC118233487 [Anguilla anguilla]|uniref:uncharacterized protein LOC118233487 n=1 Tax=Anguilla anguilla TaxID=7936 RepID=UPI0015A94CB6|nr:uncharacterized protein LOC118233487 [Anguilla anguilla]
MVNFGFAVLSDLDDDLSILRAELPCGHAVRPESMTEWFIFGVDLDLTLSGHSAAFQGKTTFRCPALKDGNTSCDAELPYHVVRKFALLTPEEQRHFEQVLGNTACADYRACPGCKMFLEREDTRSLSVQCRICTSRMGRTYEFCWQCLKEWKGKRPRADRCDNDGCIDKRLDLIRTCKYISFESIKEVKDCPSVRACPTCGELLEHNGKKCKNIICNGCHVEFCFVCLRLTADCAKKDSSYYGRCSVGTAPRQTSIPVKKR